MESLGNIMKKKKMLIGGIVLIIVFVFCYWQNTMLTVSDYEYSNKKVTKELDGYTIVQISDLHNRRFGKEQKWLLKKIENLKPDMIVITGDLVDSNHTNIEKAQELVQGACQIAPVYYVTGNHEYWLSDEEQKELKDVLEASGVILLENESITITKGTSSFVLSGLNDNSLLGDTLQSMKLDSDKLNILLAHEPQYLSNYSSCGVDLVLSGHAHGGQFILPFIGAVYAPDQGFRPKYTEGRYTAGQTTMFVSRGLGNSVIPVRLFNFPEVVCIRLKCGE